MIWCWLFLLIVSLQIPLYFWHLCFGSAICCSHIHANQSKLIYNRETKTDITSSQEPLQTEFFQSPLMEAFSIIVGSLRQTFSTLKNEIPSRNTHFLLQAPASQAGKSINSENKKGKTLGRVLTLERKEHQKFPWALPSSPCQGCSYSRYRHRGQEC